MSKFDLTFQSLVPRVVQRREVERQRRAERTRKKPGRPAWRKTPRCPSQEELLKRFNEKSKIVLSGCREWRGHINIWGYGKYKLGPECLAHRISWLIHGHSIPAGLIVCHHCDNPKCINPDHLFVGTDMDNKLDCIKKGRVKGAASENVNTCKLSANLVREIRTLNKSGVTYSSLANRFGVSSTNIRFICLNQTWRNVKC